MSGLRIAVLLGGVVLAGLSAAPAHAQKEMMGMFYEMQMAPRVCKWTDAASTAKLDASIKAQEQGFGVTDSERATMQKAAEAELKSDPSNCDPKGMLRAMFDGSVN